MSYHDNRQQLKSYLVVFIIFGDLIESNLAIIIGVRLRTNIIFLYRNYTFDVIDRIVSFVDSHSLQIDLWTPDNNDITVLGLQ